ncbi:MAG TPA: 7-cyano-7-deazaguanine synthase, partial [Streptosporangiaceae bacterium]|nr:7-cyano-7-deazaguanine synthase [Streptosporangiaceae bacterium]
MVPLQRAGGGAALGHVVAIVSGGLDSTALAYWLRESSDRLTLLSFDYGQRHCRELDAARRVADRLGTEHELVDLRCLGRLLSGSALTDADAEVPEGHYTDATMKATVVPNRNAIMLDVATGVVVSRAADAVAFGAHAGDHPIYPDCRPAFVRAYAELARVANEGFLSPRFRVLAPFLDMSK